MYIQFSYTYKFLISLDTFKNPIMNEVYVSLLMKFKFFQVFLTSFTMLYTIL